MKAKIMTERVTKYRATSKIKLRDQWTFRTFQEKRRILLKKKKQLTYLLCRSVVCLVNMSPYPISLSTRETDIYVIVPDLRHVVSKQQPLFVGIAWRRALHQIKCKEKPLWRNSWRRRKIVEIGNKKRFFMNRDTPLVEMREILK